jgi:hypothetical protein
LGYLGMRRGVRHAHQRAEPQTARTEFDAARRGRGERIDVSDQLGLHHIEPHHVDEVRAAGEVLTARGDRGASA